MKPRPRTIRLAEIAELKEDTQITLSKKEYVDLIDTIEDLRVEAGGYSCNDCWLDCPLDKDCERATRNTEALNSLYRKLNKE